MSCWDSLRQSQDGWIVQQKDNLWRLWFIKRNCLLVDQAHPDSQRRWNNFGHALQKAGDDYSRQVQQDMRAQQNRQRNCTTTFVGSTAYTNCYWCCKSGSLMPYHSGLKAIQNPQGKSRRNDSAIFNRCMHLIKLSLNTYRLLHASVLSWSLEIIAL